MVMDRSRSFENYLRIGAESIPYLLNFSPRTTLRITISPDASVQVDAPEGHSVEEVTARLGRRAGWIAKQRDYFMRFRPRPASKTFRSGETFVYLGRHYRLKVTVGREARAVLKGRFLNVIAAERGAQPKEIGKAVAGWYTERAKEVFRRRLEVCYASIKRLGVPPPKLVIKVMKRRWGSYTKSGAIVLNRELIQAPVHCIDYVIFHELIHAIVPNHGPRFYELLSRYVLDWESRKARLESAMAQLPSGITACK